MKIKTFLAFAFSGVFALSCFADDPFVTGSLSVSGTTTLNELDTSGLVDLQGNSLYFGTFSQSGTSMAAMSIAYSDGTSGTNATFSLISNRPATIWNWQRLNTSGSLVNVMQIDAANRLTLFGTNGSQGVVLDPNNGITLNGQSVLTQSNADSRYLRTDGTSLSINGNVTIGANSQGVSLTVTGNLIVNTLSGNERLRVSNDGTVVFNENGGCAIAGGNFGGQGRFNIGTLSAGSVGLAVSGVSGQTGDLMRVDTNGNTGSQFIIKSDGKVGIGVVNPTQKLQVSGAISALGGSPSTGGYGFSGNSADSAGMFYYNSSQLGFRSQGTVVFQNSSGSTTMMMDVTSGNIGIGTLNPQSKLDVRGSTTIAGSLKVTGSTNVVLINPAGDLSMGDFTNGQQPQ